MQAGATLVVDETDGEAAATRPTRWAAISVRDACGCGAVQPDLGVRGRRVQGHQQQRRRGWERHRLCAGAADCGWRRPNLIDTLTGDAVTLHVVSAGIEIEGRNAGGQVVFELTINTDSGATTLTQFRAVVHGDAGDPDEADTPAVLGPDLIGVTVTVTDGDGDQVSQTANLNGVIAFEDDGPVAISANNALVQLDDDGEAGGNPGFGADPTDGVLSDDVASVAIGTLDHAYGADGAGTTLLTGAGLATFVSGLPAAEGVFTQDVSGDGLTLTVYQVQGGVDVAVLTVATDHASSGGYEVTQLAAIDHPAGLDENNLSFTVNYEVTDGDGDTATGSLSIDVDDDTPVTQADAATVTSGQLATVNALVILDKSGSMGSDGDPSS